METIDIVGRVRLHTEMNEAMASLLGLCLRLDLPICHTNLERIRAFLTRGIDLIPARTVVSNKVKEEENAAREHQMPHSDDIEYKGD